MCSNNSGITNNLGISYVMSKAEGPRMPLLAFKLEQHLPYLL